MKKKANASKSGTEESAEPEIHISALARLAGIRYLTSLSAQLGTRYGLSQNGPVGDRLEVFDLPWVVSDILNGRQVVQWHRTPKGAACHIDLHSYLPGGQEPEAISVVLTLETAAQPSRLLLAMAAEDRRRRKD
jgi:hypothetical protein